MCMEHTRPTSETDLQWERAYSLCRGCRMTITGHVWVLVCMCGGNTEYSQLVLLLPLAVNWEMCFRGELRKEFQSHYQINPSIAGNCLSCKDLPWTYRGRKFQNKPPWILPFAMAKEGSFLSAGDMTWWRSGQKLSVAAAEGWRLEGILPWWGCSLIIL